MCDLRIYIFKYIKKLSIMLISHLWYTKTYQALKMHM